MTISVVELRADASGALKGAADFERAMDRASAARAAELASAERMNAARMKEASTANQTADAIARAQAKARKAEQESILVMLGKQQAMSKEERAWQRLLGKTDAVLGAELRMQRELASARIDAANAVLTGHASMEQAYATIHRLEQRQLIDLQKIKDAHQDIAVARRRAANDNPARGFATANIAAQLQDVAVTSAMGMSPIQIALQQGTQLSMVFDQMKASGQSAASGIASAFMSVVNPMSLITIAAVAGTAALIQYFSTGKEEAKSLDVALDAHGETIRALREAYGEAASGLREYVAESRVVADALAIIDAGRLQTELKKTTDALVASGAVVESEAQRIQRQIQEMMQAFELEGDAGKKLEIDRQITKLFQQLDGADTVARSAAAGFEPLAAALDRFAESARKSAPDYIRLKEEVSKQLVLQPTNDELRTLAERLFAIIDPGVRLQSAMESTAAGIKLAGHQARSSKIDIGEFGDALRDLAGIAVPAMTDMERAQEAFRRGMAGALDANDARAVLAEYQAAMQRIQNEIDGAKVPIPTPRSNDIERWDEAGAAIDKVAGKMDQFKSRADSIGEKLFPGEYARREAHELMALLDQYGDKLDVVQRKAVEMRIDETLKAAALGMRDLGNETGRGSKYLGDMEKDARRLEDALEDAASNFLQDLFTGKDLLESIVSIGASFGEIDADQMDAICAIVIGEE